MFVFSGVKHFLVPTIEEQPPHAIVVMCYKNTAKTPAVSSVYVMISIEIV